MLGDVDVKGKGGFTLIELAIVLIIIGLILGAVLKGKDLIESAKIKKVYTRFIRGWELTVLNYQDRTGRLLGDGTANGGTVDPPNGYFDDFWVFNNYPNLENVLRAVGLRYPITNTDNIGEYRICGRYNCGVMHIAFWLVGIKVGKATELRNAFVINNVPTDVAYALDTIIDGQADPSAGNFMRYPYKKYKKGWPDASKTPYVNVMYLLQ